MNRSENKEKIINQNKGITLISIAITVVILLILVAITINVGLGEDSVITRTQQAKERHEVERYKEQIEDARGEVALDNGMEVTLDNLIAQIYEDKVVPAGSITKISGGDTESARMVTEDGYVFILTARDATYSGKE